MRQVALEVGRENCALHPRHARAVSARLRASTSPSRRSTPCKELQRHGHLAGHHRAALRRAARGESIFRKDRAVLQREAATASSRTSRSRCCMKRRSCSRRLTSRGIVCRELGHRRAGAGSCRVGGHGQPHPTAARSACTIALVGKYVQLHDAYLSVTEALRHAGYARGNAR